VKTHAGWFVVSIENTRWMVASASDEGDPSLQLNILTIPDVKSYKQASNYIPDNT
jgi:hypothetical protein